MTFEQYIGSRLRLHCTFPAIKITRNKKWELGGQRQTCSLVFYKVALEEFGLEEGDRVNLYFDRDTYCLGLRKSTTSIGLKLTSCKRRPGEKLNSLRISIPGFLKMFNLGIADINGSYKLIQNEDGMLVANLKEKLLKFEK
jgi:hypothetical protein